MKKKQPEPREEEHAVPEERQVLPMINEAHVAGRLTNVVKCKAYAQGNKRAQFAIAVPRLARKEGQPEVDYFTIIAWGAIAEACEKLSKGDGVEVLGRIRTWQDEAKRYHWGITAHTLQVVVRHASKANGEAPQPAAAAA